MIAARRTWIAVALIAASIPALLAARHLRIDNRLERWMGRGSEDQRRYLEFRETFGSDEFILIAVSGHPLFNGASLDRMLEVLDALENTPGVISVEGLPKVFRDVFGGEDVEALADELTGTPFYQGLFISADSTTAGIVVGAEPSRDPDGRSLLVSAIQAAVEPLRDHGFEVRLVGSPVLAAALDRVSTKEAARVFPVAFLCSMAMLMWMLRSIRATLISAASAGLGVVLTLGAMAATGRSLTMVSSVLPPLLWVLALSNCVHILKSFQRHRVSGEPRQAIECALAETARPCFVASLTTAAGFGSLVMAGVTPVREVGIIAAAGILISLAVNLTVVPTLVVWAAIPGRDRVIPRWFTSAGFRRPAGVLACGIGLGAAGLAGLPWLAVDSNPLDFLPRSNETVIDYLEVGEDLTGSYTMEVVVDTPVPWFEPSTLRVLDRLEVELESREIVPAVLSPLDVLRKARQWREGFDVAEYRLPATSEEAERILSEMGPEGRNVLRRFAESGDRRVRLSAVVNEMDEHLFLGLVEDTEASLERLPDGLSGWVSGMVLRLVRAQQDLVLGQVRSLATAGFVVFVAIGLGLGSWRLTALSVIPNLVPILTVFGIMSVTRIPLDAATVMVASVALGIAVDNTVHLLMAYRRQRSSGMSRTDAAARAVEGVGSAMVITTATATVGFISLCLSAFVPIREFGLLAGAAMVLALIADLVVVPAMLVVRERR